MKNEDWMTKWFKISILTLIAFGWFCFWSDKLIYRWWPDNYFKIKKVFWYIRNILALICAITIVLILIKSFI